MNKMMMDGVENSKCLSMIMMMVISDIVCHHLECENLHDCELCEREMFDTLAYRSYDA